MNKSVPVATGVVRRAKSLPAPVAPCATTPTLAPEVRDVVEKLLRAHKVAQRRAEKDNVRRKATKALCMLRATTQAYTLAQTPVPEHIVSAVSHLSQGRTLSAEAVADVRKSLQLPLRQTAGDKVCRCGRVAADHLHVFGSVVDVGKMLTATTVAAFAAHVAHTHTFRRAGTDVSFRRTKAPKDAAARTMQAVAHITAKAAGDVRKYARSKQMLTSPSAVTRGRAMEALGLKAVHVPMWARVLHKRGSLRGHTK